MRVQKGRVGRAIQMGFTLVELIVAVSISALLGLYAQYAYVKQAEESLATGSAVYLNIVAKAAGAFVNANFNSYVNSTPITGVATLLQPTLAELQAASGHFLAPSFPIGDDMLPTIQTVKVYVQQSSCPGAGCTLTVLACTTTPVTLGGPDVRFDLASTMTAAQGGTGGQALENAGTIIRGPVINTANPLGNVEGIVCGSSIVNTATNQLFVQIGDARDPNLAGNLTVAGNTTFNGPTAINNSLSVTGPITGTDATLGPCINMAGATGRAGFGCQNGANLPAGYTGGVRTADLVANANILASDNPAAFAGNNTNYAIVTANNGTGVAEIRTSGRAVADRLTPVGQYASGAACPAADEGSIARLLGGTGLLVCQGSVWVPLSVQDTVGGACAMDGQMSKDANRVSLLCVGNVYVAMNDIIRPATVGAACANSGVTGIDQANNNETLICRQNLTGGAMRYMRLRDVTTQLTFVSAVEVQEGSVVAKPNCQASAAQPATPIIQMIPKVFNSADGGFAVFAVDNGANWTTYLRTGSGGAMPGASGAPVAIAQTYCYFN